MAAMKMTNCGGVTIIGGRIDTNQVGIDAAECAGLSVSGVTFGGGGEPDIAITRSKGVKVRNNTHLSEEGGKAPSAPPGREKPSKSRVGWSRNYKLPGT